MRHKLICAVFCSIAFARTGMASALPVEPPRVFNELGATMQSRVCGEIMAHLALGGVQALKIQFPGTPVPAELRAPVYETSAQAIVLLTMSGSLKLEERLKAGETVQAIEKLEPQAQVATALFCQRRITAWIQAKQVKMELIASAYSQAKPLIDKALVVSAESP